MFKSSKGFTLIEIMVAIALLGTISLGVMQLTKNMNTSSVKYNLDTETTLITNEIVAILSNPANCYATFGGVDASNDTVPDIKQSTTSKFAVGGLYGNAQAKILSYALSTADPDVSIATNTTKLVINFERKKLMPGAGNIVKKVKLYVEVDGSNKVTNCRSLSSSSSDIWTRGTGSTINYTGGNVGVGTTTPQDRLHVSGGFIRGQLNCRKVTGPANVNGSTAYCAADEYAISGGGSCTSGGTHFLHQSEPTDDLSGWAADCHGTSSDDYVTAFAICCKK